MLDTFLTKMGRRSKQSLDYEEGASIVDAPSICLHAIMEDMMAIL